MVTQKKPIIGPARKTLANTILFGSGAALLLAVWLLPLHSHGQDPGFEEESAKITPSEGELSEEVIGRGVKGKLRFQCTLKITRFFSTDTNVIPQADGWTARMLGGTSKYFHYFLNSGKVNNQRGRLECYYKEPDAAPLSPSVQAERPIPDGYFCRVVEGTKGTFFCTTNPPQPQLKSLLPLRR